MPQTLEKQLLEAYSDKNLNAITAKIIELYKAKEYAILREIINKISEFVPFTDEAISKCFSQLVMLYHPDKGAHVRNEIKKLGHNGNSSNLLKYSHILKIQDIDSIVVEKAYDMDEDFTPEYAWDKEAQGFDYYTEDHKFSDSDTINYTDEMQDNTFFSAVKRKFYGFLQVDLPYYYLEDHEEIEMASYDIDDLDGIRFCRHVKQLNLSHNFITDISEIQFCKELEGLYITNNQVGFIDAIIACRKLRVLDISLNNVDDISPLFELENLEYVNLIGNAVPKNQLSQLQASDVIVIA